MMWVEIATTVVFVTAIIWHERCLSRFQKRVEGMADEWVPDDTKPAPQPPDVNARLVDVLERLLSTLDECRTTLADGSDQIRKSVADWERKRDAILAQANGRSGSDLPWPAQPYTCPKCLRHVEYGEYHDCK